MTLRRPVRLRRLVALAPLAQLRWIGVTPRLRRRAFFTHLGAPHAVGVDLPVALLKQIELMIFGGLILFFLIVEPHGLARLWQITKEKLRLWPFPH